MSKDEFIELRNLESQIQGIPLCNEEYEFYYDETGNCRKFRLREDGSFNDPNALTHYFILGGFVFKNKNDAVNSAAEKLISSMGLAKNITELKSGHLCPSDWIFENFIKCDKVSKLINWSDKPNIYIHYTIENILYYAIVDIIDSLNISEMGEFVFQLKDVFFTILRNHLDCFSEFLSRHGYPDISKTNQFWNELSNLVDTTIAGDSILGNNPLANILSSIIRGNAKKTSQQENALLQNNERGELQDSFFPLYQWSCYTFLYSHHIFDEEKQIIPYMSDMELDNFVFVDSKTEPLIQLSDCIISVIAKTLFFFDSKTIPEIENYSKNMDSITKGNFRKLFKLILRSEECHPFFIHNINAISKIQEHKQKWALAIQ